MVYGEIYINNSNRYSCGRTEQYKTNVYTFESKFERSTLELERHIRSRTKIVKCMRQRNY